ncbi:hypothetical protein BOX15_Mlig021780g2, partial [Macrostomum lignano]
KFIVLIKLKMSTATVKPDPGDIQTRLLNLAGQLPAGINQAALRSHLSDLPMDRIIQCINQLTQSGKLEVLQTANRELLWRLRDASADRRLDGLDTKEVMVYEQLRAFGNKGASAQQLQSRSAMPQREIGKCLNSLEAKKLVKTVRPVGHAKKKIFMLFELEPDASLQAGTFFSGEGFDQEFVDVLCQQCTLYLRRKAEAAATPAATTSASATLEEVQQFIGQSRVSTVALSLDDIRRVLRALTLEGVVETRPGPYAGAGSSCLYRLARSQLPASGDFGAVRVPCVSCPVAPDCRIGGEISPIGCVYLTDWAKGQF